MFDRNFDAMGNPLPVGYMAISQYARDHDIPGDEFPTFRRMVQALDDEWRAVRSKAQPQTISQ